VVVLPSVIGHPIAWARETVPNVSVDLTRVVLDTVLEVAAQFAVVLNNVMEP